MSVNVYLNNKVRELPGFKVLSSGKDKVMKLTSEACEHTMFDSGEGLHFMWNLDTPIPEDLRELVEEISCYEFIPKMAPRESGIYRHKTAECELTPAETNLRQEPKHFLKIKAKNLEDIREILHLIKTGKIRPDESYEAPQSGKSHQELEELTNGLWDQQKSSDEAVRRLTESLLTLADTTDEKMTAIRKLAHDLRMEYFGHNLVWRMLFQTKIGVARAINAILDGPDGS